MADVQQAPEQSRRKRSWWNRPWFAAAMLVATPVLYYLTPVYNFVTWLTLDLPGLNREIDEHMRSMHGDAEYACLYTVACSGGVAHLELRTDLTPKELDAIKRDIWRRKFENYCTGRTTNFGIENSGEQNLLARGETKYRRRDIWTFGGGFMGEDGMFEGGTFSSQPWTPCTREQAYWTRGDGIVAGKRPQ